MAERWIDEKAVKMFWTERLAPNSAPFTHDTMHEVVDDIVRVLDDRSGSSVAEHKIPYELDGAEGPVTIGPGPVIEGTGVNYHVNMEMLDENTNPVFGEDWSLISGYRKRGRNRVGILYSAAPEATIGTGKPLEGYTGPVEEAEIDEPDIRQWVGYVWDAFIETPKDWN